MASKRFDGIYNNMYFFYNYDIRGSVTNIIDPDGKIVKGYDYDEFGGTKEKGDSAFKNDVKFTGAVHDKSANLYYMNARFYNPNTGRFITEDTYSGNPYELWTQHLYTYTRNNPVNFIDPTGHRAMYALNPEDETDEQRSTSLWQMHGYSAKDSYKIATSKNKKQKQKAIKKAQKNKAEKAAAESSTNTKVNKGTLAIGAGASAAFGARAAVNGGVIIDRDSGETGIYLTFSFGGGTPALGLNGTVSLTNATRIYDVEKLGFESGVGVIYGGVDFISGLAPGTPKGANINTGPKMVPAVEFHGSLTYTLVWDWTIVLAPPFLPIDLRRK